MLLTPNQIMSWFLVKPVSKNKSLLNKWMIIVSTVTSGDSAHICESNVPSSLSVYSVRQLCLYIFAGGACHYWRLYFLVYGATWRIFPLLSRMILVLHRCWLEPSWSWCFSTSSAFQTCSSVLPLCTQSAKNRPALGSNLPSDSATWVSWWWFITSLLLFFSDGREQLEGQGVIQDKITVCATDDSYQMTRQRMSQVEKDSWSRSAIEIKLGATHQSKNRLNSLRNNGKGWEAAERKSPNLYLRSLTNNRHNN